jgi:hypothetical protein
MFYNILWGFSIDTLSLVYNYAEQETPILCIFKYQGPYGTQTDRVFFWSQYFPRDTIWEEEVSEGAHEAWTSPGGTVPLPGRATHARCLLER